jgi:hypothetical protein
MNKTPADRQREIKGLQAQMGSDSAIARVQLIAKYAAPGTDVGIPWDLFEAYIRELSQHEERQQSFTVGADELVNRRALAAPVLGSARNADFLTVGRTAINYVYPVIK